MKFSVCTSPIFIVFSSPKFRSEMMPNIQRNIHFKADTSCTSYAQKSEFRLSTDLLSEYKTEESEIKKKYLPKASAAATDSNLRQPLSTLRIFLRQSRNCLNSPTAASFVCSFSIR